MPDSLFEVEHSTDINNSLLKFLDLQDFKTRFFIVADAVRRREFQDKASRSAFQPLMNRIAFLDYNSVSDLHSKTAQLVALGNPFGL